MRNADYEQPVLAQIMKHRNQLWQEGNALAPEPDEFVFAATKIAGVSLTRDEIELIVHEIEEDGGERLRTFDDLSIFMLRRVHEIGAPLG